jgi:tellurium resistance protein TerD
LVVQLNKVPTDVERVTFAVTIHEAETRKQNFGQVSNAFIRVVNKDSGVEIARYDLSEDASVETAMIFGEIYRHNGEWKFKAIGQGYAGGLSPLVKQFGVGV